MRTPDYTTNANNVGHSANTSLDEVCVAIEKVHVACDVVPNCRTKGTLTDLRLWGKNSGVF